MLKPDSTVKSICDMATVFSNENINGHEISRREFLQLGIASIALASCGGMAPLVILDLNETRPIHYPKLAGNKIQTPENYGLSEGCYTGIWFGDLIQEQPGRPQRPLNAQFRIKEYTEKVGKMPTYYLLPFLPVYYKKFEKVESSSCNDFLECVANMNVIPFISYDMRKGKDIPIHDDILSGHYDQSIAETAISIKMHGDNMVQQAKIPGVFIRTMREMNNHHAFPWGGNPTKFIKIWKKINIIFENEGANEYATWVWNPDVGGTKRERYWPNVMEYYPGDKYVDWVGMNAYNFWNQDWGIDGSFKELFEQPYRYVRTHLPTKPLMIAETGYHEGKGKPQWVREAFSLLKNNLPGIKAVSFWSQRWEFKGMNTTDSRIDSSPEALEAYKQAINNNYFIGSIKENSQ